MDRDAMIELAARVEAADGPNFALECEIWCALNPDAERRPVPPNYTASVDAAMTLLPEAEAGYSAVFWRVGNDGESGNPEAFKAEVLNCGMASSSRHTATASTPALALTAAALKARAMAGDR